LVSRVTGQCGFGRISLVRVCALTRTYAFLRRICALNSPYEQRNFAEKKEDHSVETDIEYRADEHYSDEIDWTAIRSRYDRAKNCGR